MDPWDPFHCLWAARVQGKEDREYRVAVAVEYREYTVVVVADNSKDYWDIHIAQNNMPYSNYFYPTKYYKTSRI